MILPDMFLKHEGRVNPLRQILLHCIVLHHQAALCALCVSPSPGPQPHGMTLALVALAIAPPPTRGSRLQRSLVPMLWSTVKWRPERH